jgi:hypothetical protein
MLGVVPENVRWKEVKWCVDYRLKTPLFYESQLGSTRTVLLKAKIKGLHSWFYRKLR